MTTLTCAPPPCPRPPLELSWRVSSFLYSKTSIACAKLERGGARNYVGHYHIDRRQAIFAPGAASAVVDALLVAEDPAAIRSTRSRAARWPPSRSSCASLPR